METEGLVSETRHDSIQWLLVISVSYSTYIPSVPSPGQLISAKSSQGVRVQVSARDCKVTWPLGNISFNCE